MCFNINKLITEQTTMKYLLIVAHCSRRMASNDEVREVTSKFAMQEHDFDN